MRKKTVSMSKDYFEGSEKSISICQSTNLIDVSQKQLLMQGCLLRAVACQRFKVFIYNMLKPCIIILSHFNMHLLLCMLSKNI